MRSKVKEHAGAGGATAIALAMVLIYSLWGASVLHGNKATGSVAAEQQHMLAVK